MKFDLTSPCADCPFRKDAPAGWLGRERAWQIISDVVKGDSSFACHKTVHYDQWESGTEYTNRGDEQFCAGALHLEHKCNAGGNLIIRLGRMFKKFDYSNLKNSGLVFNTPEDFINHHT